MKMSKSVFVAGVVAISCVVLAQGRPPMGGPGGPGRMGGGGFGRRLDPKEGAERQTQMMTQMLKLSPAQATKIKAIIFKSLMEQKKIRDQQQAAIKKVLTAAQQKQMESMRGGMGRPGGMGMGRPGGR